MSRAFISHATADRPFVENQLRGLLRALGLDVWYAEEGIQTSQQWERAILAGLEESKWFVLVMSPASERSEWVKDEVNWAIDERRDRIIPIMIEQCDPKSFHIRLPRIQWLDFRKTAHEEREKLVALIVNDEYRNVNRFTPEAAYIGINAVIQATDLPMYFADNSMRVKFYNEQLASILGFKRFELDGKSIQTIVDRFVSLAPDTARDELRARQDLLLELGIPDHCEEEHLIDLRKMVGNRYRGLQRVWLSADRVYFPGPADPIGLFIVFHPTRVDPDNLLPA